MEPATSTPVGVFEIQKQRQETVVYHLRGHASSCPHFLSDFYQKDGNIDDNHPVKSTKNHTSQTEVNKMEVQDLRAQIIALKCQLQRTKLACKQAKHEVYTVRKELDLTRRKMSSTQKSNKENQNLACKSENQVSTIGKISILTSQLMKSESSRELYADATEQLLRFVKMTKDSLEGKYDMTHKEHESGDDRATRTTSWLGFSHAQRKATRISRKTNAVCNHSRIVRDADKLLENIGKLMELDRKIIKQDCGNVRGPVARNDAVVACTNVCESATRLAPPGTRTYQNSVNKGKKPAFTISTLV